MWMAVSGVLIEKNRVMSLGGLEVVAILLKPIVRVDSIIPCHVIPCSESSDALAWADSSGEVEKNG